MITSLQNPLVKRIVGLKDRRDRQREGVFVIEGEKELLHAIAGGIRLETLVVCPTLLQSNTQLTSVDKLAALKAGDTVEVADHVFAKMAYRESTGGLLAVATTPTATLADIPLADRMLVLVVEGAEKPGNLGALLRTADGAGANAVIVCGQGVDLYNPNVVRASLGALFTVPTIAATDQEAFQWLQTHQFQVVLASPSAKTDYATMSYSQKTALVLGSEHQGLSDFWLLKGVDSITIPMRGRMDSLNVSCSGAILLYEIARQQAVKIR